MSERVKAAATRPATTTSPKSDQPRQPSSCRCGAPGEAQERRSAGIGSGTGIGADGALARDKELDAEEVAEFETTTKAIAAAVEQLGKLI